MKKLLSLFLILATVLTIISCNKKEKLFDMRPFEAFEAVEGVVYTGVFGTEKTTVKIANGMGSVIRTTTNAEGSDLYFTTEERIVISHAVVNDGVLTLSGNTNVVYRRIVYSGAGADEYKSQCRERYEEQFASKELSKEEYDKAIAELNGDEVLYCISDPNREGYKYEINIRLNEEEKTCQVLKYYRGYFLKSGNATIGSNLMEDGYYTQEEYKYVSDGRLSESLTIYQKLLNGQNIALSCTYYDNGISVKEKNYYYAALGKNGRFDILDRYALCEYREDGTRERITVWASNGLADAPDVDIGNAPSISIAAKKIYEFDESNSLISAEGYDKQDTLIELYEMEYVESLYCIKEYSPNNQGNLTIRSSFSIDADGSCYKIIEYEYDYDHQDNLTVKTTYEYNESYNYFMSVTVYENGEIVQIIDIEKYETGGGDCWLECGYHIYNIKTLTEYDAEGNVVLRAECDESGNVIK